MKIILVGYMGSGKTLIGKALSGAINLPFLDLDALIEKIENRSIKQIFQKKGEIYFRKKEREVLEGQLRRDDSFVLSLGGGTPCLGNTMDLLTSNKKVLTVYLKASNATLTSRLFKDKEQRPLMNHISTREDLNDFVRKHLFERSFYYNQAANVIVVDDKDAAAIVREIVATLF
jgi:shikimate kinase